MTASAALPFSLRHRVLKLLRTRLIVLAICCIAALVRVGVVPRQGLWVDEIFSLAMATGHSLEHPAAAANPALGDFMQSARPLPASAYRRYMEHEEPAAGPGRVIRAVLMSDSSPPLYYLMLDAWTQLVGTSDWALRLFSIFLSIACIPILAALARQLGGRRAVIPACILFALAPESVFYSTEGRMYSLVWVLVLSTAWLTLALHRRGAAPGLLLLWIVASAAGLLTHYFFAFVWGALCLWLLLHPHRLGRRMIVLAVAITGVLVVPWYMLLPGSMSAWRVTRGWLNLVPGNFNARTAQFKIAWSYFSSVGDWSAPIDRMLMVVLLIAALAALWKAGRQAVGMRWQMLWLWVIAADLGLLVFDVWQGTYTRAVYRYAIAGMPAAFLLAAVGLARLPAAVRGSVLAVIVILWIPGLRHIYTDDSRAGSPFREVAASLSARTDASDVIIVHSIPSGVLGIARYFQGAADIAPWVGQLGTRRIPEDVTALTDGKRRIFLVKIHEVGEPNPEETYLRDHATVRADTRREASETVEFVRAAVGATPLP